MRSWPPSARPTGPTCAACPTAGCCTDLAVAHRTFAERLADRQNLTVPAEDPRYGDLGQAFPPWPGPDRDAILQPPKPDIQPSELVLERAANRDVDWEAAD
jgi:hypothetical protein